MKVKLGCDGCIRRKTMFCPPSIECMALDNLPYYLDKTSALEEIERLNNIINELEKELKEDYKIWMCNSRSNGRSVKFGIDVCKTHFYNRLQKLKGDKSNETNK